MQSQPRTWPVLSGTVPHLAEGHIHRPDTGQGPWDVLHPGLTVILGPDTDPRTSAGRRGGTGKTQLAAEFAIRLWNRGELDLLVWLQAGSRAGIITGYARALADIRIAAPPGKPEAAAAGFLAWLADTGRRWLVVLDGLAEPADPGGLWPQGPGGQALVTTRLAGLRPELAALRATGPAAPAPAPAPQMIGVPAFSRREAVDYISTRLTDDPYQAVGSVDLAVVLGCQPVALALAAAYLLDSGQDCRQYKLTCAQRSQDQAGAVANDPLAPYWTLSVERARQFEPRELAWPALKLAAVLGPAWIPGAALISSAACAYVTGRLAVTRRDQANVQAAFGNLARLDLVRIEPDDEIRTVWMPAALQASVRQAMAPGELRQALRAAADAVFEAWPAASARPDLDKAFRDCAMSVGWSDEPVLWDPDCHPLLLRIGQSLDDTPMADTALSYWRNLARRSAEHLGARSARTIAIRERLARAATAAGRSEEAIGLHQELAADIEDVVGWNHPLAITSRASLAAAFRSASRLGEAISLGERVAADCDVMFGPVHARTVESLRELGNAYSVAGRHLEAVRALRRCLAVSEQATGLMSPKTIAVRRHLAEAHRRANRAEEAVQLYREALTKAENAVGTAHPDTVAAREHLAIAYCHAGRTSEAAATFEQALAEWRRVPRADPAAAIPAQTNLAALYCQAGRLKEAITLYQKELTDLERVSGPGHPDTLRVRWNLAAACHKAKRLPEAIRLGEAALADCEQILGPGHWDTLTSRANLAHAYHSAGLLKQASAQFDRALRDCERSLGPDDPLTEAVRALRKRYLAGRQGAAPITTPPGREPGPAPPPPPS